MLSCLTFFFVFKLIIYNFSFTITLYYKFDLTFSAISKNLIPFDALNSITSFGTPSTRKSFNTDKVRLLKYTVNDNIKNKVENFCIRYGNKYNNFGVIDLKTYKGYIKYISPDINSKIDNIYIDKIREIFERGVFIE